MIDFDSTKGAIFDLDGTILNSMSIWSDIGTKYLLYLGITPDKDFEKTFKKLSLPQAAEYYREHYKAEQSVEEIINGVNKMVEGFYFNEVLVKDGINEVLEKLKNKGIKMCIATATDKYLVEKALERNGILGYFSEIFTCTLVGASKDTPKIYDEALCHLGTPREKTVVFEDALFAMKTAFSAGYQVVGIKDVSEKASEDEIRKSCSMYITEYSELSKIL